MDGNAGADERPVALEAAAEAVLEAPSAVELLDSAAGLAVATLRSCRFASVVAPANGRLVAIAASDPDALRFEQMQAQVGEGPSVDAAVSGLVVSAADLTRETRWPQFVPRALSAEVRSVLSIATAPERGAVLSLYADEPRAFGADVFTRVAPFVAHIRLVLGTFQVQEQDATVIEQLRAGLESRTVIGQAQGVLMERERVTPEAAFAILRTASQHMNVKLRDIAARVVETGEDPRVFVPGR